MGKHHHHKKKNRPSRPNPQPPAPPIGAPAEDPLMQRLQSIEDRLDELERRSEDPLWTPLEAEQEA